MNRVVFRVFFMAIVAALAAYVFLTSAQLPDPVASKFNTAGNVIAYMPRHVYCAFMTLATLGLPVVLVGCLVWLPRTWPRIINIPHRDYWLAPERRSQTFDYLERHALVFSCTSSMFFAGMHGLIQHANGSVPPQLDNFNFLLMTGAFVLCIIAAIIALGLRFRRAV